MRNTKRPVQFYRFELVDLVFELLAKGKPVEATIRGTSMEPTAFDGDKVLVVPIMQFDCLHEGQIFAFKSEDSRHFVVHRIKKLMLKSVLYMKLVIINLWDLMFLLIGFWEL